MIINKKMSLQASVFYYSYYYYFSNEPIFPELTVG